MALNEKLEKILKIKDSTEAFEQLLPEVSSFERQFLIMSNYLWLFGENLGNTANNNSFYLWKETVLKDDGIDKFLVLCRNKSNLSVYKGLSDKEKKYVVWKNSAKHFKLFFSADMYFVTLSYKDITPNKVLFLKLPLYIHKPLIYLFIICRNYIGRLYYQRLKRSEYRFCAFCTLRSCWYALGYSFHHYRIARCIYVI